MNVLFLTLEYPPLPGGGIGTSLRTLSRALVSAGHRAWVLGWGTPAEFEDQGVWVRFLEGTPVPKFGWLLNRFTMFRELSRLVRRESIDIVEAHDWCGPSAGIHMDCPLSVRCHGSATYFSRLTSEPVRTSVRWSERLALSHADAVCSVSRFTADVTQDLFKLDGPIDVVPNGIDVSLFPSVEPGEADRETLLYLGTLVRKKGVLDLPAIFEKVLGEIPEARMIIVGKDSRDWQTGAPSTWSLIERAMPPKVRERVTYLGPQPPESVHGHMKRASVCLFPSYAEAFPVSWLEAMASAKPVIGYDTGWAREVIDDGVSGLLIPLGDTEEMARSIVKVLSNSDMANTLAVRARNQVEENFGIDTIAERMVAYYRDVVGRCP